MSPMIGSHVALLMPCPSFCVLVEAVTIGRVRGKRQWPLHPAADGLEAPVTVLVSRRSPGSWQRDPGGHEWPRMTVIARIRAKAGRAQRVKEELLKLLAPTRA